VGVWQVQVKGWESFRPTTRIFWDRISLSLVLRVSLSSEIVVSFFFYWVKVPWAQVSW
jgi:hypothetical protein